jgi:hypothetical protein
MITFLTHPDHGYAQQFYSDILTSKFGIETRVLHYLNYQLHKMTGDVVIFCDIECYPGKQLSQLERIYARITELNPKVILNNPGAVQCRYKLLRSLKEIGINNYNCWKIEDKESVCFPAFIRDEHDHKGSLSQILHNASELENELWKYHFDRGILIVEYQDIRNSEERRFHKYGAMRIANKIIPRHLFFSDKWVVKRPAGFNSDDLTRERDYICNEINLPTKTIMNIFNIANIEYGRMDYALDSKGKLVCFEINTNPHVLEDTDLQNNLRLPATMCFLNESAKCFKSILNAESDSGG